MLSQNHAKSQMNWMLIAMPRKKTVFLSKNFAAVTFEALSVPLGQKHSIPGRETSRGFYDAVQGKK